MAYAFCGCADSVNSRGVAEYETGRRSINLGRIIPNHNGGDTSKIGQIIMTIRLPRVVVGFSRHESLALAGVILQGILRNPLADPGIIGITSGRCFTAMIIMILLPTTLSLVPIGAFVGALVASFLVYGISCQGGLNPLRLILAGVAVAAFFGGFNNDSIRVLSGSCSRNGELDGRWFRRAQLGRCNDDLVLYGYRNYWI